MVESVVAAQYPGTHHRIELSEVRLQRHLLVMFEGKCCNGALPVKVTLHSPLKHGSLSLQMLGVECVISSVF